MRQHILIAILLCLITGICWGEPEVKWEITEQGMGEPIRAGQIAVAAYNLSLEGGDEIERATIRNPFEFECGSKKVIPGLSQGVEGMKVGEIRVITIPPELAYGDKDLGVIPPGSTLVFELEILQIKNAKETQQPTDHSNIDLKSKFQDEQYLNSRHAKNVTKPAMFEYLIRDFFTKPWRYEDGHLKIWRAAGWTLIALLIMFITCFVGGKKGLWQL